MQTRVAIKIDGEDMARPRDVAEAYNLVGGPVEGTPSKNVRTSERTEGDKDHRAFSAIAGNDFTWDDVMRARAYIYRRRAQLRAEADTVAVFTDPKAQATWAGGVKSNADLAVRKINQFCDDLRHDLADLPLKEYSR